MKSIKLGRGLGRGAWIHGLLRAGAVAVALGMAITGCGPVKMGAAAIVGTERISQARLNEAVTQLQAAQRKYQIAESSMQLLPSGSVPDTVLFWLIQVEIADVIAKRHNLTVTEAEIDDVISAEGGRQSVEQGTLTIGVAPGDMRRFIRRVVILRKLRDKLAPGLDQRQAVPILAEELTKVAKQTGVKVNPRYGVYDVAEGIVTQAPNRLSRPERPTGDQQGGVPGDQPGDQQGEPGQEP